MTGIVTTHYRPKRAPRRRKPVALEVPAIVQDKRAPAAGAWRRVAAVLAYDDDDAASIVQRLNRTTETFVAALERHAT